MKYSKLLLVIPVLVMGFIIMFIVGTIIGSILGFPYRVFLEHKLYNQNSKYPSEYSPVISPSGKYKVIVSVGYDGDVILRNFFIINNANKKEEFIFPTTLRTIDTQIIEWDDELDILWVYSSDFNAAYRVAINSSGYWELIIICRDINDNNSLDFDYGKYGENREDYQEYKNINEIPLDIYERMK